MPTSLPKSAMVALGLVIIASVLKGVFGISLVAGLAIAVVAAVWGLSAFTGSARSMRVYAWVLIVYGGAFAAQAIALPQYVGPRIVDIIWGTTLVLAGAFFLLSPALKAFYSRPPVEPPSVGA